MLHAYEIRPRKDHRGVDLISDALSFGRLWYGERTQSQRNGIHLALSALSDPAMRTLIFRVVSSNEVESDETSESIVRPSDCIHRTADQSADGVWAPRTREQKGLRL
jgi:hypothetical protein